MPEPTEAPVVAPTEPPVPEPTEAPVVAPTEPPVPEPTDSPVVAPTDAPVPAPTEAPTDAPVPVPTEAPVVAPTDAPVPEPTEAPVVSPTDAPVTPAPPPRPVEACVLPAPEDVSGDGSLLVSQLIDTQAQTVTVRATSSLGGYIAFGYSEGSTMVSTTGTPNVVVVGQSGGNVEAFTLGGRAITFITPTDSAVSNASFTESDGESVLQFTKPLVEDGQVAVSATGSNQFLWAHSAEGGLVYHGTNRGSGSTTIETCTSRRFLRSG